MSARQLDMTSAEIPLPDIGYRVRKKKNSTFTWLISRRQPNRKGNRVLAHAADLACSLYLQHNSGVDCLLAYSKMAAPVKT